MIVATLLCWFVYIFAMTPVCVNAEGSSTIDMTWEEMQSKIQTAVNFFQRGDIDSGDMIAQELMLRAPTVPAVASLMGYSLITQNIIDDALEMFVRAFALTNYEHEEYAMNYMTVLLSNKNISDILMLPQLLTACISILAREDSDLSRQRLYHIVLRGMKEWPEIYGFWGWYAEYNVRYPEQCVQWTNHIIVSDFNFTREFVDGLVARGLKLYPHSAPLLLLSARIFDTSPHVQCCIWFAKEALHYSRMQLKVVNEQDILDAIDNLHCISSMSDTVQDDLETRWIFKQHQFNLSSESSQCLHLLDPVGFGHEIVQNPSLSPYNLSLHIGCDNHNWWKCNRLGWIVTDALNSFPVSILGEMHNISLLPDSSISTIYSSHALEHISYHDTYSSSNYQNISQVCLTLVEWNRILIGRTGVLYISVPDIEVLTSLFLNPRRTFPEKMLLMSVLYGGQNDAYDYHKTGYFYSFLKLLLAKSGFCDIERVLGPFEFFDDSSSMKLFGQYISLNVKATACPKASNYSLYELLWSCNRHSALMNMMDAGAIDGVEHL